MKISLKILFSNKSVKILNNTLMNIFFSNFIRIKSVTFNQKATLDVTVPEQ